MSDLSTALSILERLIAFDTTSRNSNLALIGWVEDYLAQHGVQPRRVANDDASKANVFATVGPAAPGGVILSGHTDVVPVDGQDWTSDPWELSQREGKLFGRGTADMKTFLALALAYVPSFAAGSRPVHLAMSYDEEIGCLGAPAMIECIRAELPDPAFAIVGEPSEMRIIDGHKGIAVFEVTIRGHEAHSSLVDHGISANMVAVELMHELSTIARALRDGADLKGDFDPPQATLTIGTMQGGTAANILAGEARFQFDLRCPPSEDVAGILAPFKALCEKKNAEIQSLFPDTGVSIEQLADAPPLSSDGSEHAVTFVRKLTGENTPTSKVAYAAEAGQFQRAGFPTIICGPGSIEQAHQPDEWISLDQVSRGAAFMQRLAAELA